jgi:16S rRNA (guanine(966)-N(2))-methyltransferase RsmD
MTRIIAGEHGGRRLAAPPGAGTRPTSDRVREALFSALDAAVVLDGARVLDLYAGSGALGLEALSRGAAHALLVEQDPRAVRVIRENVRALGLADRARVVPGRVEQVLGGKPDDGEPYDVVLADPPYPMPGDELSAALAALVDNAWLAPGAFVVVERGTRGAGLTWVDGITAERSRRYGETTLWYGRRS